MSDLAPFVAAAIRDKTVVELMDENNKLKRKLEQISNEVNTVKIKNGHGDDEVVYARAEVDKDGEEDVVDNREWIVKLTSTGAKCHYTDLLDVQMSIGDTAKKLFEGGEGNEVAFEYYEWETQKLHFVMFGDPRCTSLRGSIGPIPMEEGQHLLWFDADEFEERIDEALGGRATAAAKACYVKFDEIKFTHRAHAFWRIPDWAPEINEGAGPVKI